MRFTLKNELTKDQLIEVDRNFFNGKTSVLIDGKITKKIDKLKYTYFDIDDIEGNIEIRGNDFFGLRMIINGKTILLSNKLKPVEFIFCMLPFIFIVATLSIVRADLIKIAIGISFGVLFGYLIAMFIRIYKNIVHKNI